MFDNSLNMSAPAKTDTTDTATKKIDLESSINDALKGVTSDDWAAFNNLNPEAQKLAILRLTKKNTELEKSMEEQKKESQKTLQDAITKAFSILATDGNGQIMNEKDAKPIEEKLSKVYETVSSTGDIPTIKTVADVFGGIVAYGTTAKQQSIEAEKKYNALLEEVSKRKREEEMSTLRNNVTEQIKRPRLDFSGYYNQQQTQKTEPVAPAIPQTPTPAKPQESDNNPSGVNWNNPVYSKILENLERSSRTSTTPANITPGRLFNRS